METDRQRFCNKIGNLEINEPSPVKVNIPRKEYEEISVEFQECQVSLSLYLSSKRPVVVRT